MHGRNIEKNFFWGGRGRFSGHHYLESGTEARVKSTLGGKKCPASLTLKMFTGAWERIIRKGQP